MSFAPDYLDQEPTRATVDATTGLTLLEFGAPDCGFCRAIQPAIERALASSDAAHLKIEDGAGRPLGRSFGVKLWPTLIAVRDGVEVGRLVRPGREAEIRALLETR
jgi:thioredoxin 1